MLSINLSNIKRINYIHMKYSIWINIREHWESNQGQLGEKHDRYLCALPSPNSTRIVCLSLKLTMWDHHRCQEGSTQGFGGRSQLEFQTFEIKAKALARKFSSSTPCWEFLTGLFSPLVPLSAVIRLLWVLLNKTYPTQIFPRHRTFFS